MAIHRQAKLRRIVIVGSILGAGLAFYNRAAIVEQVFDTAGSSKAAPEIKNTVDTSIQKQLSELSYTGQQVHTVNNNQPFFTADELKIDNGAVQNSHVVTGWDDHKLQTRCSIKVSCQVRNVNH